MAPLINSMTIIGRKNQTNFVSMSERENNSSMFASVPELMKRCESLVASREKLTSQLIFINENIAKELVAFLSRK